MGQPARPDVPAGAILAVVLAAGRSTRMGRPKQLLPWGDTTLLGQVLRHLQQSTVESIVVVTGHEARAVADIAAAHQVPTVHNPHYEQGEMITSLQTVLRQLSSHYTAVLVMLADQPLVDAAVVDRLLAAYRQGEGWLVAPQFAGKRGNPVLIDRRYFEEILALPAGSAPREILRRHPADLFLVRVETEAVLIDIDRPETYEQLHRQFFPEQSKRSP